MGALLFMHPRLRFQFDEPFEVEDQFNGPQRGTWYFRSKQDGEVHGPYMDQGTAAFMMYSNNVGYEPRTTE